MAVDKPYADYTWYTDEYLGSAIAESDFPGYAMKASYLVDGLTAGNLLSLDTLPDCVKDAVCAAAEKLFNYQESKGREMKSENNDGYSVSYADVSEAGALDDARMTIRVYLGPSGLLFRGCKRRR